MKAGTTRTASGLRVLRRLSLVLAAMVLSANCARDRGRAQLVIAYEDGILSLDPHGQDESVTLSVLANIYEGLVGFDPDMRIIPLVAQGYTNPAIDSWRFHLRPGVRFHNGEQLSAGDVVYSLERARTDSTSVLRGTLAAIDRITAVDSLTVEVATSRPQPTLINILAQVAIVPQGLDPSRQTVGTGPYRFVRFLPDRGVELEANERYWGAAPRFRTVQFRNIPDGVLRARALQEGEIDLSASINETERDRIIHDPRLRVVIEPSTSVSILGINLAGRDNPLADARVRRAISRGIDRTAIIGGTYHGYALPANQLVHPTIIGFDPGLPEIAPDTAAAARLLREAGYGAGLEIRLDVARELHAEIAPLTSQLQAIGIRLVADTLPWSELYRKIESGKSSFYRMGIACSFGDASEILNDLHSSGGEYGQRNNSGYRNRALDQLIEAADHEFDPARRQGILQRAMRLVMEDLPIIPLYLREDCYGMRRDLDWRPRADGLILAKEIKPAGSRR